MASLDTRRAGDFVRQPVEGLSRAGLARGLDGGGRKPAPRRTCVAAIRKLADGRLCATVPMQYAITAALTGDRSHQVTFRAALRERADADGRPPERDPRHDVRRAERRVLRDAAR